MTRDPTAGPPQILAVTADPTIAEELPDQLGQAVQAAVLSPHEPQYPSANVLR